MSNAVINRSTFDALGRVMAFFDIDENNRDLFGVAARHAGVEAFSKTFEALDMAIKSDPRNGINRRIRERIAVEKELQRNAENKRQR